MPVLCSKLKGTAGGGFYRLDAHDLPAGQPTAPNY